MRQHSSARGDWVGLGTRQHGNYGKMPSFTQIFGVTRVFCAGAVPVQFVAEFANVDEPDTGELPS